MDVYQICNAYECEQCAGLDTPSYGNEAHKDYMIKCADTYPEQYVWPRRCMDGWEECENGEDENPATCDVGTTLYPPTTKESFDGYDIWNGDPNIATWTGYGGFKSDPPKRGDFDKMFDDHYETYWHGADPVEVQNRVEVVFHKPIKFMKMKLVARPGRIWEQARYRDLCFCLDDVKKGCTSSHAQTLASEELVFETESVETVSKVEVRIGDNGKIISGIISELQIFHQTG